MVARDLRVRLLDRDALDRRGELGHLALAVGVDALGQQVVDRHVGGATSRDRPLHTDVSPVRAADDRPIGDSGVFTIAEVMLTMRPKRRATIPSMHGADHQERREHVGVERGDPGVAVPVPEAARAAGRRCW